MTALSMAGLSMVGTGRPSLLPISDWSNRTRRAAGGSCCLRTNPLEECSTAETPLGAVLAITRQEVV